MKPYDLYLRFLVTKGCNSVEEINEDLARLALPVIDSDEFETIHSAVHNLVPPPVSEQIIEKKYHGEFLKWMKVLEVADLWYFERPYFNKDYRHFKLVYDIHQDPQLRLTINALLLKGVVPRDLCQDVNSKFSCMMTEKALIDYKTFFWNVNRMARRDWRSYLTHTEGFERAIMFSALSDTIEIVRTNLELPSKAHLSETLQYLYNKAFVRAKHYLRHDSPKTNAEARKWMDMVMVLADKYAKHRTGDVDDFSKTLQLEFEYIDKDFPTPDDMVREEVKMKTEAKEKEKS